MPAESPNAASPDAPIEQTDLEIRTTRVFNAPRDLVFRAWTTPDHLARWWGPTGFTLTTHSADIRAGGQWRFTMHGPDGRDYPNLITFHDVTPPARLAYSQGGEAGVEPVAFEVTITFEELSPTRTKLTMVMAFPTAAMKKYVVDNYGAIEGLAQHLARLEEFLAQH